MTKLLPPASNVPKKRGPKPPTAPKSVPIRKPKPAAQTTKKVTRQNESANNKLLLEKLRELPKQSLIEQTVQEKQRLVTKFSQYCLMVTIVVFFGLLPGPTVYDEINPSSFKAGYTLLPITLPDLVEYPVVNTEAKTPNITAKSVIIADPISTVTIWQKNQTDQLPPASLAKMLTALVAVEHCQPDQIITTNLSTPLEYDESRMGFKVGEQFTFEDLLYGMFLPSGNDAAQTVALACRQPDTSFTTLLSNKAKQLQMTQTHFTNPAGKDEPGNFTTAQDLKYLTLAFLKNPLLRTVVKTPFKRVLDVSKTSMYTLNNTNLLLARGFSGIKTGTSDNAGQNYIGFVTVDAANHQIFLVELGSEDRFQEALALLQWVKQNVSWKYPGLIPQTPPEI